MKDLILSFYASVLGPCDQLGLPCETAGSSDLQNILNILFGIIGALSVIIIVVSGFQYVVSAGNPDQTSKAKSTLLHAIIGLVVSLSAVLIVNFVINRIL